LLARLDPVDDVMTLLEQMTDMGRRARAASRALSRMTSSDKEAVLLAMADALDASVEPLLEANRQDQATGRGMGLSDAMMERLTLDPSRVRSMAQGLRDVARLPDPVGRTLEERQHPNGLRLSKVRVPIGVIVIIYESRPNVTADAASLCFKTGNAVILRGGKEALHSNQLIARLLVEAGRKVLPGFPVDAIQVVPTPDREAIPALLSLTDLVDLCIPRGGESLIRAVSACSRVPVIKHYKGVCHVYVDGQASPDMAESIVVNAKCQRPSVCNAAETLLVDRQVADALLPRLLQALHGRGVRFHADSETMRIAREPSVTGPLEIRSATDEDYATEYNDRILNVRVVDGVQGAIEHIQRFGSGHSDAIVTQDPHTADLFLHEVDSAAVYWNASTRFTDGSEFGMGAEIGISTDKIGARGPMGLEELCSYKWMGLGSGQIRS
jgi:glutamate-5-semialdehyde dehydrogenase